MNHTRNSIVASITRAKLELDAALEDLDDLPMLNPMALGFIAHALKNYLHIASGTIELLHRALAKNTNEEIRVWVGGLQTLTGRMSKLVDVARAKPETHKPELKFEKIDFVTLVERACEFYRRLAARKRIEILVRKPRGAVPKVRADRIAVAAILDNLLSNAVQHSPPEKLIWVHLEVEGNSFVCRVRDEGPGMKAKDRKVFMKPMQRIKENGPDTLSTEAYGLSVASQLVAHLGGEIECQSEPGEGSCFSFTLPCQPSRTRKLPGSVS